MIVAATGHRNNKIQRASEHELHLELTAFAKLQMECLGKVSCIISGMALGWDQAVAEAAVEMKIPFIAAVPFIGQEQRWRYRDIVRYQRLLKQAQEVVVVNNKGSTIGAKFQARNEWMVNKATYILALWDGSAGGTANCVRYAMSVEKKIDNVWELWTRHINPNPDFPDIKELVAR